MGRAFPDDAAPNRLHVSSFSVPGGRDVPFGHVHVDGSLELAI
jgi:hypothetical protein